MKITHEALKDERTDPVSGGEFNFIARLREQASQRANSGPATGLTRGIGDDAAVVEQVAGRESVITTDLLVEGIDFRRDTGTPFLLGHKALAVSLSDIAAMGARPKWALLSVGVPREVWDSDFLEQFYEGFLSLADRYDIRLIGGDTSRTPEKIVIDSIVIGECARGGSILRSGAKPGDQIFISGSLGGAAAGLRLLENGARLGKNTTLLEEPALAVDLLLRRHLQPEPRVGWGIVLGQGNLATAMIDLSDGLSSDLNHLCKESGVGALVESSLLPLDPSVTGLSGRRALDPLMLALHGGEDFELLFTVASESVANLPRKVDGVTISHIGEVVHATEGVKIRERSHVWDLEPSGWDHFGAHHANSPGRGRHIDQF